MGNCQTGSAATLKRVLGLKLIDTDEPTASLLLQKPLDVTGGGVEHGGGEKFDSTMDDTYQSFLRFIRHYADCQGRAE